MSYFVYRALTPDLRRIRLIHLQPKSTRAPSTTLSNQQLSDAGASEPQLRVACTISHVCLDQPPPYFALSYTWGDASQKARILIGDTPFDVTKNLEAALFHLAPDDVPLTLWIDALCIDQNDEVEKTEQVQQMKQIYLQATSVITWLGPATVNSDAAMHWIQRYGSLAHSFSIGTKPELRLRRLLQTFESDPDKLPHKGLEEFLRDISTHLSSGSRGSDSVVIALSELFERAYWSRVWVVQEVVHGNSVQFVCGNMAVSEELVHYSLRLLRNFGLYERIKSAQSLQSIDSTLASSTASLRNPINILKIRRATGPFPLIYLIRALRYFQATDPRDRIFALLSFATDAAALGLKPDYRKSCKEVYLETATSLVRNGFLDIFQLCQVHKSIPELPSWVPDFTSTTLLEMVKMQRSPMS
ncbi:Heterokaryon incompatibility protein 6, OR allele-like protein [Hapsidospora chrysogenum ATCC 11550]|uniref:Heterokaryon incompatibility protein 6, OR allele-like protein n=1 Tax=Hapsidospora chrysogenum (strain ATCC 11550 / CBS 779.69 / DSM 880 / IAM 14645 / JCM 23072 / IMI 49137) TaxID=857340 RepID=A0A086T1E4_HAPC1|nr:Heterokaryon incompatibility protein 6, OR allele-like protein [Hapsidospora chrysogenum ATCC 11550]